MWPGASNGTQLTVRVLNVAVASGIVRVALCRDVEWDSRRCVIGGHADATTGVVEVHLEVPPGIYGVLVHHDGNGNGLVDKNRLGLPIEGVGFSRNARILFGFPSFSAVRMPIDGETASTEISLIFEPQVPSK